MAQVFFLYLCWNALLLLVYSCVRFYLSVWYFACLQENGSDLTDKITVVTLLYEDETKNGIVGEIHSKYYTLSCVEKVGVVTVVMSPMTVG